MVRLTLPAGLAAVAIATAATALPEPALGATTTRPRADSIRDSIRLTGLSSLQIGATWKADPRLVCGALAVPGRKGVSALVRNGRVVLLAVRTAEIPTLSGVKVGDDVGTLQRAYGARLASDTADRYVFTPTDAKDQKLRMAFDMQDGRVAVIRAGLADSFGVTCSGSQATGAAPSIGDPPVTGAPKTTSAGLRLLPPAGDPASSPTVPSTSIASSAAGGPVLAANTATTTSAPPPA